MSFKIFEVEIVWFAMYDRIKEIGQFYSMFAEIPA